MAIRDPRPSLRLLCTGFSPDEVGALRSLLGLLDQYLKQTWRITEAGDADLVLLNLDARAVCANDSSVHVVGCALKPRAHPSGTIHRPLRAAEILSVLNEHRGGFESNSEAGIEWRFRLHAWPMDFSDWPKEWWRVLALMTPTARTVNELAARSEVPVLDIERCIARLRAASLVERLAERCVPPRSEKRNSGAWRGLAQRVGRVLGFRA